MRGDADTQSEYSVVSATFLFSKNSLLTNLSTHNKTLYRLLIVVLHFSIVTSSLNILIWILSIMIYQQSILSHWADPGGREWPITSLVTLVSTDVTWQPSNWQTSNSWLFYSVCCVMRGFLVYFGKCLTFRKEIQILNSYVYVSCIF